MDEALEPELLAQIDAVLARFNRPPVRIDDVATRCAGRRRFVDLHMHMPADWPLARAAALRGELENALMAAVPGLHPTIQLLPLDVEARRVDIEAAA